MSLQRKRGQWVTVFPTKVVTNNRDVEMRVTDEDNPIEVRAALIPQRSAKAEVVGQQQIEVYRMEIRADIHDLTIWSEVLWQGARWDFVTPPQYHHGSRHTRHWTVDIRRRPETPVV